MVTAAEALAAAKDRWPGVTVDDAAFLLSLEKQQPVSPHAPDLYLAMACITGNEVALRFFDELLGHECELVGRRARDVDVTELQSALRTKLLVEPASLRDYTGQGSLKGWLAAVVVRASLNARRGRTREESRAEAASGPDADDTPLVHPELELLRARHKQDFNDAFKAALATLDTRDRALLRLNAVDGLGLDRIARLRNVGRSTAARWLAAIREQLLVETRRGLQERLGAGDETVNSLLVLLRSQLDVSLRTWLDRER